MTVCNEFYILSFSFWVCILFVGQFVWVVDCVILVNLPPKIEALQNTSQQLNYEYNLYSNETLQEFVVQMYTKDNKAYPVARKVGDGQFVVVQIENQELSQCYKDRLKIIANILSIISTDYICDNNRRIRAYVLVTNTEGKIIVTNSDISQLIIIVPPFIFYYASVQNVMLGSENSVISCYVASSPCSLIKWNTNIVAKKIETITIHTDSNEKNIQERDAKIMLSDTLRSKNDELMYNCITIGMFYLYRVTLDLQNQSIGCVARIDPSMLYQPTVIYPEASKTAIVNVNEPPSEPLNLTTGVLNFTYVLVQWEPPKDLGNPPVIDKYQIKLFKLIQPSVMADSETTGSFTPVRLSNGLRIRPVFAIDVCNETNTTPQSPDCLLLIQVNDTIDTFQLYDSLYSDTFYAVRVAAINHAGMGPATASFLFNGPNKNNESAKEKYIILVIIIICTVALFSLIVVSIYQCQNSQCCNKNEMSRISVDLTNVDNNTNYAIAHQSQKHEPSIKEIDQMLYERNCDINGSQNFNSSLDKLLPCTFAKYPPPAVNLIENMSSSNRSNINISQERPFEETKNIMHKKLKHSYLFNKSNNSQLLASEGSSMNSGVCEFPKSPISNDTSSELQSPAQVKIIKNSTYV